MEIGLFSSIKEGLGQYPVALNVVFAFLLAAVEKMLEVEFACPCNPTWNAVFVAPFYLIPAVTATFLMLMIHGHSLKENTVSSVLCCLLPLVVWSALMFVNGQYMVCAKTNWQGTFISSDNTYLKWCKPINVTARVAEERLNRSHRFYILSQGIGTGLLTFLLVLLILYTIWTRGNLKLCRDQDQDQDQENAGQCLAQLVEHPPHVQRL